MNGHKDTTSFDDLTQMCKTCRRLVNNNDFKRKFSIQQTHLESAREVLHNKAVDYINFTLVMFGEANLNIIIDVKITRNSVYTQIVI